MLRKLTTVAAMAVAGVMTLASGAHAAVYPVIAIPPVLTTIGQTAVFGQPDIAIGNNTLQVTFSINNNSIPGFDGNINANPANVTFAGATCTGCTAGSLSVTPVLPTTPSALQSIVFSGLVGGTGLRLVTLNFALTVKDTLVAITGQVRATPVPAAVLLFGSALAGLGVMRRRRNGETSSATVCAGTAVPRVAARRAVAENRLMRRGSLRRRTLGATVPRDRPAHACWGDYRVMPRQLLGERFCQRALKLPWSLRKSYCTTMPMLLAPRSPFRMALNP